MLLRHIHLTTSSFHPEHVQQKFGRGGGGNIFPSVLLKSYASLFQSQESDPSSLEASSENGVVSSFLCWKACTHTLPSVVQREILCITDENIRETSNNNLVVGVFFDLEKTYDNTRRTLIHFK